MNTSEQYSDDLPVPKLDWRIGVMICFAVFMLSATLAYSLLYVHSIFTG